jgi:hypothetical protein
MGWVCSVHRGERVRLSRPSAAVSGFFGFLTVRAVYSAMSLAVLRRLILTARLV